MNYSFSISTRSGDEYRIMFIDADISLLAENVRETIANQGIEYKQFMHLIARSKHQVIVDLIKDDVIDGWGK
ncbi:MAG: hypothetical protein IJ742_05245 [Prevotella sp.]|nr:hypothetical protein [Prevotella sp.]